MSLEDATLNFQERMSNLFECSKVQSQNRIQIEKELNEDIETFKTKLKALHSLFKEIRSLTSTKCNLLNQQIGLTRTLTEKNPKVLELEEKISGLRSEINENYKTHEIIQTQNKTFEDNPEAILMRKKIKDLEVQFQHFLSLQQEVLSREESELALKVRKLKNDYRIMKTLNRLTSRKLSKEASVHLFTNREEFQSLISESQLKEATYQSGLVKASNSYPKIQSQATFNQSSLSSSESFLYHILYFLIGVSLCLIFFKICPFL